MCRRRRRMATAAKAQVRRTPVWFIAFHYALILVLLLAAFFFWRPLTALNLVIQTRLWISGGHDGVARAGPYRIHYIVAGSGRSVVLLHGLGADAGFWGSYMPHLARHSRVYAID